MAQSGAWDGVLNILRDPIFGLVFAVLLTILGSVSVWRVVKTAFWLGAIVILIWLAAHNATSAHVEIAIVTNLARVLLIFIAALFAVAVIAMAVLLVMYLKSAPASSPLLGEGPSLRARTSSTGHEFASPSESDDTAERFILEESGRFSNHLERITSLLEGLFSGVDSDHPVRACAEVMRIYFSGLSASSAEIKQIHEECNMGIARLVNVLAIKSVTVRLPLSAMRNKKWFPTSGEWAAVAEDSDLPLPYLALRIICLKADWRTVAMVMYKSYACLAILTQIDEL